jgi:hypothetical protein
MAARKKVWDLGDPNADPRSEPVEIDMWAVNADDAVLHDPERYTFEIPTGKTSRTEIPENWPDLPSAKKRGLAIKLGAPNTIKVVEVDAFIEDELAKRTAGDL